MASKREGDIWIAISYDGKLTGSYEHRCYNHTKMLDFLKTTDESLLSPIGIYAKDYDVKATKSREPNFDGILAYIAVMRDEVFNSEFHYVNVEYSDRPIIDALNSGLSTCLVGEAGGRELFGQFGGYSEFKHVFILGPVSPRVLEYVNGLSGNIIFHFQGEPPCKEDPARSTTSYSDAMTVYDGIFPTPFNFWTGETEAMQIRAFMNHKFTVKCRGEVKPLEMNDVNSREVKKVTLNYPVIFVAINDCIIRNEYLKDPPVSWPDIPIVGDKLNIACIAEDLIDKDNATACAILMKNSAKLPQLLLIGRRVYNAGDIGPKYGEYRFKPSGLKRPDLEEPPGTFLPPIPQPTAWPWMCPCVPIGEEGRHTEVQFPGLDPKSTMQVNQSLNGGLTIGYHKNASFLFMKLLNESKCKGLYIRAVPKEADIVDGMGDTSTSLRSPFHEKMVATVGIIGEAMENAKKGNISFGGTKRKKNKSKKRVKRKQTRR